MAIVGSVGDALSYQTPGDVDREISRCNPGNGSYANTTPVIISGTNIARTGLSLGLSTGTFSGNLSGNRVTGTLKAVYKFGAGTLVMPVTLVK